MYFSIHFYYVEQFFYFLYNRQNFNQQIVSSYFGEKVFVYGDDI